MKKKIVSVSIIVGIALSVGLGVTKGAAKVNNDIKQTIKSNSLMSSHGPTIPVPEFAQSPTFLKSI